MLPAVLTRSRIVLAAAALLATACSSSAVDESPDAAPETSVAVTTTVPPSTTTTEAPEATEPAASEPKGTEPGQPEPEQQPVEPPDPEGVGDSFYPKLGNPGYDVLHYDIDLDVEPSANTISALTAITAQATEDLAELNHQHRGVPGAGEPVRRPRRSGPGGVLAVRRDRPHLAVRRGRLRGARALGLSNP